MNGKSLIRVLGIAGLLLTAGVLAQPPVKSVDAEGNVTYSDRPVPGAVDSEVVPVAPPPDAAEVKAARERMERTEKMAEEARREREAREKAREEARHEAEAARPEVVIIREESAGGYYPEYANPPLIKPRPPASQPKPPAGGRPDHPAYRPPAARPPVSIQPVPR